MAETCPACHTPGLATHPHTSEPPHDEPRRVQLRRTKGWRKPDNTTVVARPTRWGNPFVAGAPHPDIDRPIRDDIEAVRLYKRELLAGRLTYWDTGRRARLTITPGYIARHLAGHNLGCWCPVNAVCHADVLLELANPPKETDA